MEEAIKLLNCLYCRTDVEHYSQTQEFKNNQAEMQKKRLKTRLKNGTASFGRKCSECEREDLNPMNSSGLCPRCYINLWTVDRYKNDIQFKLASALRGRLRMALHGNKKVGSAVDLLGCSVEDFKLHLESRFTDGMSWDNYGHGVDKWNMDHMVALYHFDLTDLQDLKKACHYTNIQPMWHSENCSWGAKIKIPLESKT